MLDVGSGTKGAAARERGATALDSNPISDRGSDRGADSFSGSFSARSSASHVSPGSDAGTGSGAGDGERTAAPWPSYDPGPFYDEMISPTGEPRAATEALWGHFKALGPEALS